MGAATRAHVSGGRRALSNAVRSLLLLCALWLLAYVAAATAAAAPRVGGRHSTAAAAFVLRPPPRRGAAAGPLWAKRDKKPKPSSRRRRDDDGAGGADDDDDGAGAGAGGEEGEYTPRVSSQINIPVRRQIAFARQMKKLMKAEERPGPAQPPKKVRKKKSGTQKPALASDYPAFDPNLCTTYLLVDGYNVINAWSKMIKARSVGGMPTARAALLEQLRYISQARRWKVVVAYDEHTPGSELRVMEGDVDEVFTGELESADSYIERRAVELCASRTPPTVKVATDDRTIQVVSLAGGAEMMSTSSLIREIYLARRELLYQRDGGDGWASRKQFEDSMDYFD